MYMCICVVCMNICMWCLHMYSYEYVYICECVKCTCVHVCAFVYMDIRFLRCSRHVMCIYECTLYTHCTYLFMKV